MAAGWMQLGEVFTHLLPRAANPDSLARAAFDEAYRLDPAAKSVLFHSIEIRVRQGDTQSASAMLRDFRGANPDSLLIRQASLTHDCAARGPRAIRWLDAVRAHPLAVLGAANALKGGGAHLACAEAAFKAIIASDTTASGAGRQWSAIVGLTSTLLAQNRLNDASAVIDSSLARGLNGGLIYLMAAPLFPGLRAAAEATAQRDRESYGENYEELAHKLRLWQLGVWEALHGRSTAASSIASDLTSRARESGTAPDRRMARSMTAFAALSRGDTAFALRTLRSVLSEPVPSSEIAWDMAAPRGLERLILARLMVARKDFRNAIAVANVFDAAWPSVYLLYVPASLEVRVAAASAVSEERMASHFRRRLAALRGERAVAGK